MRIVKKLNFYIRCINATWAARHEKNNRQKWRRLARTYQKIACEMDLNND